MTALYNEYLTGAEREAAIDDAVAAAEYAKLNLLYEAVDAKLEADLLAAEAKVLTENGTYDDLTMLYMEANQEADVKKENLITRFINWITGVFTKLGQWLTGSAKSKIENLPANATVNISEEEEKHINGLNTVINWFTKPFEVLKGGTAGGYTEEEISKSWKTVAVEIGIGATAAAATTVFSIKKSREWALSLIDDLKKKSDGLLSKIKGLNAAKFVSDTVNAATSDAKSDNADATDKNGSGKSLLNKASETFSKILKYVIDRLNEVKDFIKKLIGSITNRVDNTNNAENQEAPKEETPAKTEESPAEPTKTEETPAEPVKEEKPATGTPKIVKYSITVGKEKRPIDVWVPQGTNKAEFTSVVASALAGKNLKAMSNKEIVKIAQDALSAKYKLTPKHQVTDVKESAEIIHIDIDEDTFFESELIDNDYAELIEAFAEL